MIPKIEFIYSRVYDDQKKESEEVRKRLKELERNYPSKIEIIKYIESFKKSWSKESGKILEIVSKITGLKWKERKIKCYVIGFGRSYSDPLTISLKRKKQVFRDTLIHELIHQIQTQNSDKFQKWIKKILMQDYSKESLLTKNHIFLHAVLKEIYLKLYNKNRVKEDIKRCKNPDYKRAWEIVEKEGHTKIINKFKEVTI